MKELLLFYFLLTIILLFIINSDLVILLQPTMCKFTHCYPHRASKMFVITSFIGIGITVVNVETLVYLIKSIIVFIVFTSL